MQKEKNNRSSRGRYSRLVCYSALSSAIICICTLISIPLPFGYFNLGDGAILLSSWMLGPLLGSVSAAFGSALSDILLGYAIYAPATAIIKSAVALVAYFLYVALKKVFGGERLDLLCRLLSAMVAEMITVIGYFTYESLFLGYGAGAFASVGGNIIQGIAAIIIAVCVSKNKRISSAFKNAKKIE